jgi:hypothetical protein
MRTIQGSIEPIEPAAPRFVSLLPLASWASPELAEPHCMRVMSHSTQMLTFPVRFSSLRAFTVAYRADPFSLNLDENHSMYAVLTDMGRPDNATVTFV